MLFSVALVSNDQVINIFVLKRSSAEFFFEVAFVVMKYSVSQR